MNTSGPIDCHHVTIRGYKPGDHEAVATIFCRAIYEIAREFYSEEQCRAWSDHEPNPAHWRERCQRKRPFIAEVGGEIAGFLELDADGHIDCTYVNPRFKRRGVATLLVQTAIETAFRAGCDRVFVEASHCARPMFEKLGFAVVRAQSVVRKGVALENFSMELRRQADC